MAITITLAPGETFTLDETSGLQNGADGTPTGSPTPDSDVAIGTLPTAFSDYLFGSDPGELNLDNTYPTDVGVASSSTTFIHVVSDGGPMSTLGLTDADGDPFTGTTVNDATSSNLFTTGGDEIFLISDLDNQVVLGMYDSDGDDTLDAVAFAVYMKTDGTLGTDEFVQLWSVTFTPIDNPMEGDTAAAYDDAVDLLSLVSITATGTKTFNFDALPAGQNLFGMVGDSSDAIVVTGELPVLKSDGTYTNTSDTINTSKGGGPTTIGIDNQSFDPIGGGTNVNDGAFFTYVENPDTRYLAGAPGGLNQNEADDADNVLFGNTKEVDGAFFKIVQVVGNGTANLTVTAYDLTDNTQDGRTFVQNQGAAGGTQVDIDEVYVYSGSIDPANLVESYSGGSEGGLSSAVTITVDGDGTAHLSGLEDNYVVVWHTTADHDQVLVRADTGSAAFDIGLFGLLEGAETNQPLVGTTFVEDSGPSFSADIDGGTIAYDAGATPITHTLNGLEGTDSPGTYAITSFTSSFDLLGVHVIGADPDGTGQTIQYFQDVNSDGDYDAGTDVLYYTMSLTPAGSYTFTVNGAPAAPPLTFDFDTLPSGSNLFGSVANDPDEAGIFVFGENPVLNSNSTKYTNASDVIHTSQGGIGATIGVNNQMFDAGEGAFFTFVDDITDNFLSGVPGGLTSTEADYGKNLQYDSLHETAGAFIGVSQIQAGSQASMAITAFLIDPSTAPQGVSLINASGQSGDAVDIFSVSVFAGSVTGTLLESYANGAEGNLSSAITITIDGDGVAHVSGLDPGMVVAWSVDDPSTLAVEEHNQVLIQAEGGKFDVGLFGFSEPQQIPDHNLDFQVTLTDADGDFVASNTFQISVDA